VCVDFLSGNTVHLDFRVQHGDCEDDQEEEAFEDDILTGLMMIVWISEGY
jgi:hypothetical protein